MAGAMASESELVRVRDETLVESAVRGDRPAFAELYRRYVRRIHNLAVRMTSSTDVAEDATQEIFLQAYKNLKTFQGRSGFYTWVYRIACNICLQLRKRERRREVLAGQMLKAALVQGQRARGPEVEVERRITMAKVAAAVPFLPDRQRLAVVLGPIQGHSYDEMARILGVSTDVVKGLLHRGRRNLRLLLEGLPPQAEPASLPLVSAG